MLLGWMSINTISTKPSASIEKSQATEVIPARILFDKDVKPIFENHCNPCHFPGGKMYDKLPFNHASTIVDHEEGILRRIKDEAEVKTIKEFVSQEQNIASKK